ncbi:aspartate/glutamate racemase family protein [Amycolatopsis sp. NBC_01480]|uniref:aspartate/glutamate racemase family protein n=1 Tax=Amycolatopsis sp. NBC_01480 TaxID=2903562 RepID=UPI002E290049|nr:aspartate/glutamate racemase family protein [Amycolatopsis sp. NBC_01480]
MKLSVVLPIITETFVEPVRQEVTGLVAPGTDVEVRLLAHGPASIESRYDEVLAGPAILAEVEAAAADGADAVFVNCFGDPAVHAARELVDIPVVGGYEPAMLTAMSLGDRIGIVTVLPNVVPLIHHLARQHGLADRCGPVRVVDLPVLALHSQDELLRRLVEQASDAVSRQEADVIVLGCTGMLGVAAAVQEALAQGGTHIPVIDPTAAAVGWLEHLVRLGARPSRTTYQKPPAKARIA